MKPCLGQSGVQEGAAPGHYGQKDWEEGWQQGREYGHEEHDEAGEVKQVSAAVFVAACCQQGAQQSQNSEADEHAVEGLEGHVSICACIVGSSQKSTQGVINLGYRAGDGVDRILNAAEGWADLREFARESGGAWFGSVDGRINSLDDRVECSHQTARIGVAAQNRHEKRGNSADSDSIDWGRVVENEGEGAGGSRDLLDVDQPIGDVSSGCVRRGASPSQIVEIGVDSAQTAVEAVELWQEGIQSSEKSGSRAARRGVAIKHVINEKSSRAAHVADGWTEGRHLHET